MKICIVSSAGGHLIQCLKLLPILKKYNIFIITFKTKHLKKSLKSLKLYRINDPRRDPKKHIKNLPKIFIILRKERPNIVVTTGAGIAIPVCLLAKFIFKSKLIFIESFSRIYEPSLTGRILYFFSDIFLVQWKPLLKRYGSKTIYGGSLL